jgi:hypothetical protein
MPVWIVVLAESGDGVASAIRIAGEGDRRPSCGNLRPGENRLSQECQMVFALLGKTWNGSGWIDDFSVRLRQLREG